jgi:hypothetical protein
MEELGIHPRTIRDAEHFMEEYMERIQKRRLKKKSVEQVEPPIMS